jgi:Mg2+ and Co2+ transporter CorA
MSVVAMHSRPGGHDEAIDIGAWTPRRLRSDELLWIDMNDPSEDEIRAVVAAIALPEETGELLDDEADVPLTAVRSGAVEVVVRAPGEELDDDPRTLRILIGDEWVITTHRHPLRFLEEHRERIQDHREVGRLSPVQFLIAVLNWHVDAFLHAAEQLEGEVDALDDAALRTERDLLRRLVRMRRRIAGVRRMLAPHREVFAELSRPDLLPDLEAGDREQLSAMVARLERAADAIGNAREMLIGTFDVHMTRTAQRTNDIVRVLTWASVVLLPASVIAGVMGMNFQLGFFEEPAMFWFVVAAMLAIAVGTLVIARVRGWL